MRRRLWGMGRRVAMGGRSWRGRRCFCRWPVLWWRRWVRVIRSLAVHLALLVLVVWMIHLQSPIHLQTRASQLRHSPFRDDRALEAESQFPASLSRIVTASLSDVRVSMLHMSVLILPFINSCLGSMLVFFPQELINAVLDELCGERATLAKCCLVSRSFLPRARANLWFDVTITGASIRHLQQHPSLLPLIHSLCTTRVYDRAAIEALASFNQEFHNIERVSWALDSAHYEPLLQLCSSWKLKVLSLTNVVASHPGDLCSFLKNLPSLQSLHIDENGDCVTRRVPCQCQDSRKNYLPRIDDFQYHVYTKDTQLQESFIAGGCICSLQQVRSVLLDIGRPMSQLDALLATFPNSMQEFTLYGTVNGESGETYRCGYQAHLL